jgi:hypothetical protein
LVKGSTQALPQATFPAWQGTAQAPRWQVSPPVQAVPAVAPVQSPLAPHQVGSIEGSTQAPPQATWAPGQVSLQAPATQVEPAAQTDPACAPVQLPLAPHQAASVWGSIQAPPQATWVPVQTRAQVPAWQGWLDAQATPALAPLQSPLAPQWSASVRGSAQVSPQLSSPSGQIETQAPLVQSWVAVQRVPQAPQWSWSLCRSTQLPLHFTLPPAHSGVEEEDEQPAMPARTSSNAADLPTVRIATKGLPGKGKSILGSWGRRHSTGPFADVHKQAPLSADHPISPYKVDAGWRTPCRFPLFTRPRGRRP